MPAKFNLNLEELIRLNGQGDLIDYSSLVDIENQTNREVSYTYVPAVTDYQPGHLVVDDTLRLSRIYCGREEGAVLAEVGRRHFDERLSTLDILSFKFVFKDNETKLLPGDHLQFRTTFSYYKGNPFRSYASSWDAQPALAKGIRVKGVITYSHRFGLKVPKPGELKEVKFVSPGLHPKDETDVGDDKIYWWEPSSTGGGLQVSCTYKLKFSAKRAARKVAKGVMEILALAKP